MNPNNLGYTDYETFTGVKSKIFPAASDPYAAKDRNEGCLIKDAVTRDAHIRDGFSNTLMIAECASRPDTYKASNGRSPTGDTNQCIGWADSVGPYKLDGMDSNGDKCKNCAGNIPFNVTNNGEAYSMHPGVMNCVYADGSTRTINDNVDLRAFAAAITRAGGEVQTID
jgi:prepilin-type processing-associated H-X9-DG protein